MKTFLALVEAVTAIANAITEHRKQYRVRTYVQITREIHGMENDIFAITSSNALTAADLMRVEGIKTRANQLRAARSTLGDPTRW